MNGSFGGAPERLGLPFPNPAREGLSFHLDVPTGQAGEVEVAIFDAPEPWGPRSNRLAPSSFSYAAKKNSRSRRIGPPIVKP